MQNFGLGPSSGRGFLLIDWPSPFVAGTGRTGYLPVPPNNYPFYNDNEKYIPVMQADGGQLSGTLKEGSLARRPWQRAPTCLIGPRSHSCVGLHSRSCPGSM